MGYYCAYKVINLSCGFIVNPNNRPVSAKSRKMTKQLDHIWYSMMAAIFLHITTLPAHSLVVTACFDLPSYMEHGRTINRSANSTLSTSFNYIYEQRNLRFPTSLPYWLFQDGCQIAVSIDAELIVHTDSGLAYDKYCCNLVLLCILKFFYGTDPSDRHAA